MILSNFRPQSQMYALSNEEALVFEGDLPQGMACLPIDQVSNLYYRREAYSPKDFNPLATFLAKFQIFGPAYLECQGNAKEELISGYDKSLFSGIQNLVSSVRVL